MSLFRLDASIRTEGSHSRQIADIVEAEWLTAHPGAEIVRRHIGADPLPATAWADAALAGFVPEDQRSDQQRRARALAATLSDELLAADALLFAVPLYNFGVSQHFKTWVDLVITDERLAAGAVPLVQDKPAVLVVVRGGAYGAGTPREGWDHSTGWLRRILEDVWHLDLRIVETEFTLADVNPALAEFRGLAQELRAEAERTARAHGRALDTATRPNRRPLAADQVRRRPDLAYLDVAPVAAAAAGTALSTRTAAMAAAVARVSESRTRLRAEAPSSSSASCSPSCSGLVAPASRAVAVSRAAKANL
jgi:FMN-dependent NADH-azoreductase